MKILSWNVQWCRGIDGRVDPERIVREAKRFADFDVLCLQEIADNYPAPRLAGNDASDQFATVSKLLPEFTVVSGVAVDQPAGGEGRRRFGNMILSRLPVRQAYRWLLPFPHEPGKPGMPRIAVEAVVTAPFGDVRVVTTHLEWYSIVQRSAQVEALRRIYADGYAHARASEVTMREEGGPFETFLRPKATVICGDFNLEHVSELHARIVAPFEDDTPALVNAWDLLHPGKPYPATFCIYNRMGNHGQLHCDFYFASPEAASRIEGFAVDQQTQASDHQPIVLTLR
ncbi:MAG TPA: endonuclease/exonuclease/phosphatase family protein [Casimicrobiaceae bacterium]|nr:endonuclease/exonuclease/phosphatase family protein [Casimicrobiaceae bacterium]